METCLRASGSIAGQPDRGNHAVRNIGFYVTSEMKDQMPSRDAAKITKEQTVFWIDIGTLISLDPNPVTLRSCPIQGCCYTST